MEVTDENKAPSIAERSGEGSVEHPRLLTVAPWQPVEHHAMF